MPPLGGIPFGTSELSGGGPVGDIEVTLTGDVTGHDGPQPSPLSIATTITDGAVTNPKLAPEAVTIDKMAADSVGTNQIINNAVEYGKIQNVIDDEGAVLGAATTGPVTEIPFKGPARDIGAQSTVAGVRSVLGIRDIGDFRNWAIAQAKQRLGLTTDQYPQVAIDEPFFIKPGSSGNVFASSTGSPVITVVTDLSAGWARVGNAGGAEASCIGAGFPCAFPTLAAKKWYVAALVRFAPGSVSEEATIVSGIEMVATDFGSVGPGFGIKGDISDTKFSCHAPSGAGTASTVDIDDQIHVMEMWGPDEVDFGGWFSVDGETPIKQTMGSSGYEQPCYPRLYVNNTNGEGNAQMDFGHLVAIAID